MPPPDLVQLLGDGCEGLGPGHGFEATGAPSADASKRVLQATRIVDLLEARGALGTEPPEVEGRFRVTLDAGELPALDVQQRPAAAVTHATCAGVDAVLHVPLP